jgi:hypothetical protein
MSTPWRFAALALFTLALPLQAQHRHRADDPDELGSTIDTTVALSRGGTVDLTNVSGQITVVSWDREEVKIHAVSDGGRLNLDTSPSRVTLTEHAVSRAEGDTRYDVTMPSSARLLVQSISGDIRARAVNDVEAHTVSGNSDVSDIPGHVTIETIAGDIVVARIGGGARVGTVSGDIRATAVKGEIAGQSVSGDVTFDDVVSSYLRAVTVSGTLHFVGPVDPKGRYEFRSHSGEIELGFTGGSPNARLELETFSGDVDSACGLTLQPGGDESGTGRRGSFTIGTGNGARFIIQTFSGDVRITGCRARGEK